jgi:hypothetical protein
VELILVVVGAIVVTAMAHRRGAGHPTAGQVTGQVAFADRPSAVELAGEHRGVVDGNARCSDFGCGSGNSGDDGVRPAVPLTRGHSGDRVRGERRQLLVQGWTLPLLIRRLHLSRFSDDYAADREEELKAERVVHDAADEVLAQFRANPPAGMDPRVLAEIRAVVARHSQDADEMPDPDAHTKRSEVFAALYRDVLAAQREALIAERDEGGIEDEAVRGMLERLDLQEAGVSARLESRF